MKKKHLFSMAFIATLLLGTLRAGAQVSVNTTGAEADTSAMLDVGSTSKGFLPPRMTAAQRAAISLPATGLLVFQTDGTAGYYYNNGTPSSPSWTPVSNIPNGTIPGEMLYWSGSEWMLVGPGGDGQLLSVRGGVPTWITVDNALLFIGQAYQGGILAYILQPGDPGYSATTPHGLIAAPSDQSTGTPWGTVGLTTGATGTAIGTGAANTSLIIASGPGTAAYLCSSLSIGGYTDWYLPSQDELLKLYLNRVKIGFSGFFSYYNYWSSSESSSGNADFVNFNSGFSGPLSKSTNLAVRAVRSF